METITVKKLAKVTNAIVKDGYGDRKIMVTNDDEGNGTHELFGLFSLYGEGCGLPLPYGVTEKEAINDYIILG